MAWRDKFKRLIKTIGFLSGFIAAIIAYNDASRKGEDLSRIERELGKENVERLVNNDALGTVQGILKTFLQIVNEIKKNVPTAKTKFLELSKAYNQGGVHEGDRLFTHEQIERLSRLQKEFHGPHIGVVANIAALRHSLRGLEEKGFDIPALTALVNELETEYWEFLESENRELSETLAKFN